MILKKYIEQVNTITTLCLVERLNVLSKLVKKKFKKKINIRVSMRLPASLLIS